MLRERQTEHLDAPGPQACHTQAASSCQRQARQGADGAFPACYEMVNGPAYPRLHDLSDDVVRLLPLGHGTREAIPDRLVRPIVAGADVKET